MNNRPTPETDAAWSCFKGHTELLHDVRNLSRKLERERDELQKFVNGLCEHIGVSPANTTLLAVEVLRIQRERDEVREANFAMRDLSKKIEQQRKEIVRLNGATSHSGGTPLKIALRERDEARAEWGKASMDAAQLLSEKTKVIAERDELREEVASLRLEAKYHDEADALRKCRERERDEARYEAAMWALQRDEAREQAIVMHEQWLSKGRCCENLAEELHEVKQQRDEAREENKKSRKTLEWIAERYDDSKPMHQVAMDAYEMSCTAKAALRKEETK